MAIADVVRGHVIDESGVPVPYATVFQKSNPAGGVATDDDGMFEINVTRGRDEILIISFISYKTVELEIDKIKPDVAIRVTLKEQPILLDEASVNAMVSKKEMKKITKNVLSRFYERLKIDFPKQTNKYEVVSVYSGKNADRQLMRHRIVGTITEYPKRRKNYQDSIRLDISDVQQYVADEVVKGYVLLNDMADKRMNTKKAKKKGIGYNKTPLDEQSRKMHRFLWGGESCFIVDRIDIEKPRRWQYTMLDGQAVLIYSESWNYLVAKATMKVYFYIDPATCSLLKMTQCFDGELHIPFGYKLDGDELDFVNALQLPDETIEKYRVRHVYTSVKRNVIFNGIDAEKRHAVEKNADVSVKMLSSKKEELRYSAKSKIVVTK
ncbi:MAG: carboxypeptidase-like regulatory domain-containing protein [Paludibacteraceae bacterium]|nr:carboxypeptidase-like regulatory domain-containing protein [Paludibacteraceae bacterium]